MKNIHIKQARVIDPSQGLDRVCDIFISQTKIVAVGDTAPDGFIADESIDAQGWVACPGFIDTYAGFNTRCFEQVIDTAHEAQVCSHAGITSVCYPPDRGLLADHPNVAKQFRRRQKKWPVNGYLLAAMTQGLAGESLTEMAYLKEAGCIGVSQGDQVLPDAKVLRHVFEYAAGYDLTVFLQAQDPHLSAQGCVHEGQVSTRLGLPGIPETAETVAISTALLLAEQTGVRLHFNKLSTARGVDLIAAAQQRGLNVSADVSAHHLHLSEIDVSDFNPNCHVVPPLRNIRDRDALRAGLQAGILSAVCSDHQPMSAVNKQAPFAASQTGISSLETLLPLTLQACGDLKTSVQRLTAGPAAILGLDKGNLAVGKSADVCLFDPETRWLLSEDSLMSQGKNSPFIGWELCGQVKATFLAGEQVYQHEDSAVA